MQGFSESRRRERGGALLSAETVILGGIFLLLFEDPLSQVIPLFGYLDELFALGGFLYYCLSKEKTYVGIWIPLSLFVFMGLLGYFFNSTQPFEACVFDLFLNLKFFLSLAFGLALAHEFRAIPATRIFNFCQVITYALFALLVFNFIFDVFPGQEQRFGMQIPRLFFSHSEYLAGAELIVLALGLYSVKGMNRGAGAWLAVSLFVIACTLRYKAMAAALFALALYYLVAIRGKKLTLLGLVAFGAVACLLAWGQIVEYFFGETETARGLLQQTSFEIAGDYFPLGTGFGSFASYMSGVYYSDVYFDYGLSGVWGLMNIPGGTIFISDTFWPMIVGQTGVAGFACYAAVLIRLFRRANDCYAVSLPAYIACILLLVYLLVQSTASAAFVGPLSVPIGFIVGCLLFPSISERKES